MMEEYVFKLNELVNFDTGLVKGCGLIKGMISPMLNPVGKSYIVEILESDAHFPNETYPYTTIIIFDIFISKENIV